MTDLTASAELLRPVQGVSTTAKAASPEKIRQTAEDFEATFLSQMLKPMFQGLSTDGLFGGGQAEETWRGFLIDEMAKTAVKAGGIGLAAPVMNEMLKMQEKTQ